MANRQALQALLAAVGVVGIGAGLDGVVRGAAGVRQGGPSTASTDSELRFFAAWYAVAGALALHAARNPGHEATTVQAVAAGFGLAAAGRLVSWRRLGAPHPVYRGLLAAEVALAAGLVPWQRRVARD